MAELRIELHARQLSDIPTLRALRGALERRGEKAQLTVAPGLSAPGDPDPSPLVGCGYADGPAPCLLRVMVAGRLEVGDQSAQRCAIIVDEIGPAWRLLPTELGTAELVFVPGRWQRTALGGRCAGELVAAGLARLDELVCDPTGSRARARAELRVPPEAEVVLYAPSEDPRDSSNHWLCDEVGRLPASGPTVLVLPCDDSPDGLQWCRELAASVPGLAFPEGVAASSALAACDVVIADRASLLYEAAALGRGAVLVELEGETAAEGAGILSPELEVGPRVRRSEDLAMTVRSALPGSSWSGQYADARARCRSELLVTEGSAAERMAGKLIEYLAGIQIASAEGESVRGAAAGTQLPLLPVTAPGSAPRADLDEGSQRPLERSEALLAFGDTEAACATLVAHLEREPSPRGYRLLASIYRKQGDTSAALAAVSDAEQLARRETAEALCERGRVLVDSEQVDAAREVFEQAQQLAPDLVDALVGLGSLAVHRSDAANAEECFRAALAREKSTQTLTGLGLALLLAGRPREALHPLEQALDIQADFISAVYGIVQAAFQTGELALAERRVRAFVQLHSGNLDLVFTLAGLRYQIGDRAGSLEMIERIELFDPHYPGLQELKRKLAA
ncbi:MAG: tetratricopeptide repeat protein [Myxococcota bacterium]